MRNERRDVAVSNRPLGDNQVRLLSILAGPGTYLVVGDRVSDSLIRRGLASSASDCGRNLVHICADGLRRLAEEAEAGRVDLAPKLKAKT